MYCMVKNIGTIIANAKLKNVKKVFPLEKVMTDMDDTLDKIQRIHQRELDAAVKTLEEFKRARERIAVLRKKQNALLKKGREADAGKLVVEMRNLIAATLPAKLETQK